MSWSSVDITVNYHRFCGLYGTDFTFSQHGRSEANTGLIALRSRNQQGCLPSGSPSGESLSSLFPASRGRLPFRSMTLFLHLQSQRWQVASLPRCHLSSSLSSASLFHFLGPLWLHWICLANPGDSCHLRVSWLATLIPPATFIPFATNPNIFTGSGE